MATEKEVLAKFRGVALMAVERANKRMLADTEGTLAAIFLTLTDDRESLVPLEGVKPKRGRPPKDDSAEA